MLSIAVNFKGVCVPSTCSENQPCPDVGEVISGVVTGKCFSGKDKLKIKASKLNIHSYFCFVQENALTTKLLQLLEENETNLTFHHLTICNIPYYFCLK